MNLEYFLAASVASLPLACALVAAPAAAQQITTGIEGTVTDENGARLAGATVTITDTRTGATRTITTGSNGGFTATGLVTGGPYEVSASADGFEGQTVSDIQTTLQGNTSLTFTLASGGGTITVTASRVRATQLDVGPGTSFARDLIEATPTFNRDVRDVIRIDPRVSLDRDDGGSGQDRISCLGGNDRGNAFTVDGISQGDIYGLNDTGFSSRSSTPIPFDAVRETQVQFAPFDVEYGNFTGCAINVVTRSGANDFHGGGFFEYSDNGMRGNTVSDRLGDRDVAPIEPDKRWGAWLSGPILRDRLFFFGAYEHQEAGQSQDDGPSGAGYPNEVASITAEEFNEFSDILSSVYGIETGPLVTNRPYKNDRYFGRLDWQITDNHRLELTYQRLEESTTRPDDISTTASNALMAGQNTFYLSGTESNYYSGRLYSQWTDRLSTELRYSRSDIQDLQDPVGGGEAQSGSPIPRIVVGVENDGVAGRLLAGPGFSRSANDLQTKVDAARFLVNYDAGDHQLKLGAELNHADLFNLFVQNATGELHFSSLDDLRNGILSNGTLTNPTGAQLVNGTAVGAEGNFSATGDVNDAAAAFQRTIYSVYAQDDWRLNDALSAVLGVRVDWYNGDAPRENPNFITRYGFGNAHGFSDLAPMIMPRAALTYDMDDFAVFARPQIKGGLGVFSGGDPLVWFGNAFQNDGRGFAGGTTTDPACGAGPIVVVEDGQFTGLPDCFQQSASDRAAAGLGDTQSISPDIKMPSVIRANIGFSAGLDFVPSGFFSGWNLNLDYIYSHYRNPLTLVDLSQTPDIRKAVDGTPGYAIDGRPIYAAIDPTVAGCDAELTGLDPAPVWSNVSAACFNTSRDDELHLLNGPGYDSHVASAIVSKDFDGGVFTSGGSVFFSLGYSYTDAHDRRNMYNSTAGSNYDLTAAFDRQNPAESRGFYSSKHNIATQLNFEEQFFDDLSTRLGITFIARSGRPYSLTFTGGGVFNDSASGFENALLYIPSGMNDPNVSPLSTISEEDMTRLRQFVTTSKCANDHLGQTIERNTCSNDWYYDMDLTLSQEIPGPGHFFGVDDKIKLFATFDNFLNFLNSDWNVQHRRNFSGLQDIAQVSGVDLGGPVHLHQCGQPRPGHRSAHWGHGDRFPDRQPDQRLVVGVASEDRRQLPVLIAANARTKGAGGPPPAPLSLPSVVDAGVERVAPHLPDAPLDGVAVAAGEPARAHRLAFLGQWQHGGDARGLGGAEMRRRMAEVALRPFLDSVRADPGLGNVEIDLHDPPLAPDVLDQQREPGLEPFAEIAAALPQEHVLGGLLADRRAAADAPAFGVALDRLLDRLTVETVVLAELAVLAGDHRADHVAVDPAERRPVLGDAVLVHQHGRGHRHRYEAEHDHQREAETDEPDGRQDEEVQHADHAMGLARMQDEKNPPRNPAVTGRSTVAQLATAGVSSRR